MNKEDELYFMLWTNRGASYFTRGDIIEWAQDEIKRQGTTIEDVAGLEWDEDEDGDMQPERELTEDEIFKYSIEKLGDNCRFFEVFLAKEENTQKFIEAAKRYKLEEEARELVEDFLKSLADI